MTVIDKIKMNHDHSLIGFTVDIGNTERLTGGIKCMKTNKILSGIRLEDMGAMEFSLDGDSVYFTQMDANNRPYKVSKKSISTGTEQTIFVDDDPTHYVDIGLSKDQKYLVINTATKEDSEVWVIENSNERKECAPILLIPRQPDVRVHIEHLRNFFIIITNDDVKTKNFKLQVLYDEYLHLPEDRRNNKWKDILSPSNDDSLIISEFDCF